MSDFALIAQLRTDADEIEACGAGNEAATMRRAAEVIEEMRDALLTIADVWTLPPPPPRGGWHCQHEEFMCAASTLAASAIDARQRPDPEEGLDPKGESAVANGETPNDAPNDHPSNPQGRR